MSATQREIYILRQGDAITCAGGIVYTITGEPIGYGGSSIVYPAVRNDTALEYAIKECFPAGHFHRTDGVVCPENPGDPEAVGLLKKYRNNLHDEAQLGQWIRNSTTRAISIRETLNVTSITTGGRTYTQVSDAIFSVLERMDQKAVSFDAILDQIRNSCTRAERHSTMGLPNIHTTACLMEEILTVIQAVHRQGIYYGDLHNGNVYFTETDLDAGKVGIAHLLDFGSSRALDADGNTMELTGNDVFSTKGFRPPEMLTQGSFRLTKKADLYSAGCLMLRCTTTEARRKPLGESPSVYPDFLDKDDGKRIRCSSKNLVLVNEILEKSLAANPADRYADADAMLNAIRTLRKNTAPPSFALPDNLADQDFFLPGSRSGELDMMADFLRNEKILYIWGVGGIGKTETAIALAKRIRPEKGAYLIHYEHSLRQTILSLPFEGYIPPTKGRGGSTDQDADYKARMDILKKHYADALFVIDNFESPTETLDQLRAKPEYKELTALSIQLIFTTRCPVPWQPQHEIQPLSIPDQLALMRHHCPDPSVTDEQFRLLIDEVGGNTLTICLIAKTLMASEGTVHAPELLHAFQESRVSEQDFPSVVTDQNRTYREATLYGHLTVLFNLSGLGRPAQTIMDCCAFLPGEGMDIHLFRSLLDPQIAEASKLLVSRGWLKQTHTHALCIHPLIRETVREAIRKGRRGYMEFLKNLDAMYERERFGIYCNTTGFFSNVWVSDWMPDRLTPAHLRQITEWACAASDFLDRPTSQLLWLAAALQHHSRRPVMSRHYAKRALALMEDAPPSVRLAQHYYRAVDYFSTTDWDQCPVYEEKACALLEELLTKARTDLETQPLLELYAKTCVLICHRCASQFRYAKKNISQLCEPALEYGEKALTLASRCHTENHFLISRIHHEIANTYDVICTVDRKTADSEQEGFANNRKFRKQFGSARQQLCAHRQEAYNAAMQMEVPHPSWQAMMLECLGNLSSGSQAREYYQQAVDLLLTVSTPNEQSQDAIYSHIADLYYHLGEWKKVLAYKMRIPSVARKWYHRYLDWLELQAHNFDVDLIGLICSHNLLQCLKGMVYCFILAAAMASAIIPMLFLLAELIRELITYYIQNRKDSKSLKP